jgi:hypothetical protein
MIDVSYHDCNSAVASRNNESLEEYVRALLTRQKALDLLEVIHEQINDVWAVMRRLLDYTSAAARASQAVRVARAAQATQAQNAYRSLEKRREECIAALQQAERRASAALQSVLVAPPAPRAAQNSSQLTASRGSSRKLRKGALRPVLNLTAGTTDAFSGN